MFYSPCKLIKDVTAKHAALTTFGELTFSLNSACYINI